MILQTCIMAVFAQLFLRFPPEMSLSLLDWFSHWSQIGIRWKDLLLILVFSLSVDFSPIGLQHCLSNFVAREYMMVVVTWCFYLLRSFLFLRASSAWVRFVCLQSAWTHSARVGSNRWYRSYPGNSPTDQMVHIEESVSTIKVVPSISVPFQCTNSYFPWLATIFHTNRKLLYLLMDVRPSMFFDSQGRLLIVALVEAASQASMATQKSVCLQ